MDGWKVDLGRVTTSVSNDFPISTPYSLYPFDSVEGPENSGTDPEWTRSVSVPSGFGETSEVKD